MTETLTQEQWMERVERAWNRMELKQLHEGSEEFVYALDGAIVKMGYRWEYDLGKILFENGVHVPEMYAFANWRWGADSEWEGHEEHYLVMQWIKGIEMAGIDGRISVPGVETGELAAKLRGELRKVIGLGIVPKDGDWYSNSLFVPEEGKIYLVDFARYYRGSQEQLEAFEKRISRIEHFLRVEPEF